METLNALRYRMTASLRLPCRSLRIALSYTSSGLLFFLMSGRVGRIPSSDRRRVPSSDRRGEDGSLGATVPDASEIPVLRRVGERVCRPFCISSRHVDRKVSSSATRKAGCDGEDTFVDRGREVHFVDDFPRLQICIIVVLVEFLQYGDRRTDGPLQSRLKPWNSLCSSWTDGISFDEDGGTTRAR
jgi:hypothetical protein